MVARERMQITDVRVLAALAHPVRLAILHLLLTADERTATECATAVDASPSACSYHLRHLERFGLVARVDAGSSGPVDGRTRRWRAVASGFDFGAVRSSSPPELVAASVAVILTGLDESSRLVRHYLAHLDEVPDEWHEAAVVSTYALSVTADELREVRSAIEGIVRPLRQATRENPPDDARPVHLSLTAFPRTDLA